MKYRLAGIISLLALIVTIASCENEESLEFKRYYSGGSQVYQSHCQNCHGANGEGLSALIPPLTDSVFLKNNKTALPCYVHFGLKDAVNINGKVFEGTMPSTDLTPMEIAQVLTYITNSFGNKLGVTTIDAVQADQKNCK